MLSKCRRFVGQLLTGVALALLFAAVPFTAIVQIIARRRPKLATKLKRLLPFAVPEP
jgi:hypothetical protein